MIFRALLPSTLRNLTGSIWAGEREARENGTKEPRIEPKANYRPPLKLREANLEDYEQIVAIQNRNGLASRARENWLGFWQDNPVYRRRRATWPIGWLLEDTDCKIVGWLGNLPSAYYFARREVLCASASPWVVDESYRGYSMLLLDRFTRQKDVHLLVNTTAGPTAGPVCNLFGYSKVPVGDWDKSAFWITNYCGFLRVTSSMKGVPLAENLSYPLAAVLFLKDYFKSDQTHVDSSFPQIELCSRFDSRFDDFWEQLKQQRSDILLAVRTQETLEWHFREQLAQGQLWIFTACKESRIIAVALLDRRNNGRGLKSVRLVDFQALPGWEKMLRPFLSRALEKCRSEGIHLLEVTGCWLDRPGLPRVFPPHYRGLPSWIFYYKALNEELARALQEPTVWAPSSFDGDASV